jgi:hypothetical protein
VDTVSVERKTVKISEVKTLTGVPYAEIVARLREPFEAAAYKAVPGGADLTDINTGYMIERLTEVFGLRGLGWNLEYNPEDLVTEGDGKRVMSHLKFATFSYALVDNESDLHAFSFPTSGKSENMPAYSEEGARTNALGAAVKTLCFQVDVYKNKLNHHNAGKVQNSQPKANGQPKTNGQPAEVPTPPVGDQASLMKWAKDSFGLDPAGVGAALKKAEIKQFDPNNWEAMVKAIRLA